MNLFHLMLLAQAAPETPTSFTGWALTTLYLALAGALLSLAGFGASYLSKRTGSSVFADTLTRVTAVGYAAITSVETELRPAITAALADGTITPEELTQLKDKAIAAVKLQLGEAKLEEYRKKLGISDAGFDQFLWGLIAGAVKRFAPADSTLLALVRPANPAAAPTAALERATSP